MSEIRATTISNAAGTGPITMTGQYAAKAWVYAQQRTATVEIKNSFNVSSWSDDATGRSTLNLSSGMSDSLYSISASNSYDAVAGNNQTGCDEPWQVNSSSYKHDTYQHSGTYLDADYLFSNVLGDLA